MPDNKTLTFDASQYQLVPKVPTDEMLDAASHASMQHLLDCINDPVKARELGSEENARKTHASRYQSMLAAAPTPAAQSAGQEADAFMVWYEDGNPCLVTFRREVAVEKAIEVSGAMEGLFRYAAPVNGGDPNPCKYAPEGRFCDSAINAELLKALDFMVNRFEGEFGLKFSQRHALKNARAALAKARGDAVRDPDDFVECQACYGKGFNDVERQVAERKSDVQTFRETCDACEGTGKVSAGGVA